MSEEGGFQETMKSLAILSAALIVTALVIKVSFWFFDDLLASALAGIFASAIILAVALRSLKTTRGN